MCLEKAPVSVTMDPSLTDFCEQPLYTLGCQYVAKASNPALCKRSSFSAVQCTMSENLWFTSAIFCLSNYILDCLEPFTAVLCLHLLLTSCCLLLTSVQWRCMLSTATREWRRWFSLGQRGDSRNPPWRRSIMPRSADLHTVMWWGQVTSF